MVKSFTLNNLVPFSQVLTNKFERNLKIGAQRLDRKLGHALIDFRKEKKIRMQCQIRKRYN